MRPNNYPATKQRNILGSCLNLKQRNFHTPAVITLCYTEVEVIKLAYKLLSHCVQCVISDSQLDAV